MANTSVSGLVSGLDTATIISQLMQIEAQPQTNLRNRVSAEQKVVTALQAINAKFAGINTKAGDLAKLSNWSPMTATSTNDKVTVNATSGAMPASFTMTVKQLATSSVLDYGKVKPTDAVFTDTNTWVTFTKPDGKTVDLDTKDGTIQGLVKAINSTDNGATASLINLGDGTYRLQITATKTGPTTMALAAKNGAALAITGTPTAGQQAQIVVGQDTISSDSNTFTGLMTGVNVTLQPGATGSATITVGRDEKSMSDSVKAMVDAVNSVLDDISTQTGYNTDTKTSGPLAGEGLLRDVRNQLLNAVTNGVGGKSLADVGIQVDRYGKLVFDETKFQSAYAADPNGVAAKFVDSVTTTTTDSSGNTTTTTTPQGLASALAAITKSVSDAYTGALTLSIKGHNDEIKSMNDNIADWDVRLAGKQAALQRQYAALEVALGKLQDQASWLSGQIANLPKMSS